MRPVFEWQKVVHRRNKEKGFYDYDIDLAAAEEILSCTGIELNSYEIELLRKLLQDYKQLQLERKLLLAIGEICEAHEELRSGREPTEVYYRESDKKPEGFGMELADAHIRLLDLAAAADVDTETMMSEKHDFNGTRPHRHNKSF